MILSGFTEHLPIQLVTRYGEKMCFIKYHVSEDRSSVETLCCVSPYHEPVWHFDAKFVDGKGHEMANILEASGHCHFLEMKNSAYHCPSGSR